MNHQEYNGWYNYETWLFGIHFSADDFKEEIEGIVENYERKPGDYLTDDQRRRGQLAEYLGEWFGEYVESQDRPAGILTDLLNAAASEVNFDDIAENWLSK